MQHVKKIILASMVAMSVISSAEVNASAFQIWEQDEAGLGSAHSGGAAEANSASTSYYNPAGMVRLDRPEVTFGAALIYPIVTFNGTLTKSGGAPIQMNNEQGGKQILPVPNFHAALPFEMFGHKAAVGFSVVSVFDAFTDWADRNDPLENAADISNIKSVTMGPTFAFAVTEKFSIGAGLDVSYSYNEISQGLDVFSTVEFGYVDNNFSGFGVGGHLGVMYQFTEKTRVGVTYFSPITYHLNGTSKGTGVDGLIDKTVDTSQTWTFPEYVIASIFHNYEQFDVMGTVTWTHWSRIQDMKIESLVPDTSIVPPSVFQKQTVTLHEDFKDTIAVLLGTNYHYSEKFTYKFGLGYDMSPTSNAGRNLQLPDSDRLMASVGFQYRPHDDVIFDVGYMYVYALPTTLNYTAPPGIQGLLQVKNDIKGDIRASAHVLGAQITLKF